MEASTPQIDVGFYSRLREREAQAREFGERHLYAVHDTDSMLYWLAAATRRARVASGRLQVHVAASASVNQSTIDRFESHIAWPRDADKVISAYADDLDVTPIELWTAAVELWQQFLATGELPADERAVAAVERPAPRIPGQRPGGRKGRNGGRPGNAGR